MELEKKVLAGIMEFLDGQEGEVLKKHPKLKKEEPKVEAKLEVENPEPGVDPVDGGELSEDDLTPEMIQKLIKMHDEM